MPLMMNCCKQQSYFAPYDIFILYCDKVNNHIHNKILTHSGNTGVLILTEPHNYDTAGINDVIFQNNVKLLEVIAKLKSSNKIVLHCNNSLRESNYYRDKLSVTMIGKRFLSRKICDIIQFPPAKM